MFLSYKIELLNTFLAFENPQLQQLGNRTN